MSIKYISANIFDIAMPCGIPHGFFFSLSGVGNVAVVKADSSKYNIFLDLIFFDSLVNNGSWGIEG